MLTTYQVRSKELDSRLIESIKSSFPDEDLIIDVYSMDDINNAVAEITNPEIISRIKDIENNKNIISQNQAFIQSISPS